MALRREPRAIVLVLDSVGAGELPDAADVRRRGLQHARQHVARRRRARACRTSARWGSATSPTSPACRRRDAPTASWGTNAEVSAGKDTTTGHWEMMGIVLETPFPTYPDGFPPR